MARPLWRELRHQRAQERTRSGTPAPTKKKRIARFGLVILSTVGAIAAAVVASYNTDYVRHPRTHFAGFIVGIVSTFLFVVLGIYATRRLGNQLDEAISLQGGRAAGSAVRLITLLAGFVVVILTAISLLGVPVSKILVGGAITGIVLGIAAQQSLGNIFAGIVLIVARPFTVGSRIRVRSGALGGIFDGEVTSLGLTYVVVQTEDGPLFVPNLSMLAAGVVRLPDSPPTKSSALYVNRSTPKRPPRHTQAPHRRQPASEHSARLPRELIRRMRERRIHPPATSSQPTPPSAASPPAAPAEPADGSAGEKAEE